MNQKWKGFWAGSFITTAYHSLLQDIIGKEAYLKIADAGWISPFITVPMALILLFVGVALIVNEK